MEGVQELDVVSRGVPASVLVGDGVTELVWLALSDEVLEIEDVAVVEAAGVCEGATYVAVVVPVGVCDGVTVMAEVAEAVRAPVGVGGGTVGEADTAHTNLAV